jgi:hypothetical protein
MWQAATEKCCSQEAVDVICRPKRSVIGMRQRTLHCRMGWYATDVYGLKYFVTPDSVHGWVPKVNNNAEIGGAAT